MTNHRKYLWGTRLTSAEHSNVQVSPGFRLAFLGVSSIRPEQIAYAVVKIFAIQRGGVRLSP